MKSKVVQAAGGVGMILVDEADKDVAIPFVIPAAVVGKRTGNKILSYINRTRFVLNFDSLKDILCAEVFLGWAWFMDFGTDMYQENGKSTN